MNFYIKQSLKYLGAKIDTLFEKYPNWFQHLAYFAYTFISLIFSYLLYLNKYINTYFLNLTNGTKLIMLKTAIFLMVMSFLFIHFQRSKNKKLKKIISDSQALPMPIKLHQYGKYFFDANYKPYCADCYQTPLNRAARTKQNIDSSTIDFKCPKCSYILEMDEDIDRRIHENVIEAAKYINKKFGPAKYVSGI